MLKTMFFATTFIHIGGLIYEKSNDGFIMRYVVNNSDNRNFILHWNAG